MTKTVSRLGVYSFAIFTLALTGCPSPKQANVPNVPHPLKKPKDLRARPVRTDVQKYYDSQDGLPLSLKQSCAEEICGQLGDEISASDIERGRVDTTIESQAIFNKNIAPKLDTLEAASIAGDRAIFNRLRSAQNSISKFELTGKYRNLANQLFLFEHINTSIQATARTGSVDAYHLQTLLPNMSAQDRADLATYTNIFVSNPHYKDLSFFGQLGLDDALTATGRSASRKDLPKARKQFAELLKSKVDKVAKAFPTLEIEPSPAVVDLAKGRNIELLAQEQISGDIPKAMMADFLDNTAFNSRIPQYATAIEKFYSSVLPKAEADLLDIRAQRLKANADCQLAVDQVAAMNLTSQDIADFKKLTEQVRKEAIKSAEHFSPANAKEKVRSTLETVEFNFPASSAERIDYLISKLDEDIQSSKIDRASEYSEDDLALMAIVGADDSADEEDEQSELSSACRKMKPEQISDYSLTGFGKINISWQTVKFETGVGVLGHEFGHVTSRAIQEATPFGDSAYKSVKECTASRHSSQLGQTATDEEDFADVFAAEIVKAIGGKPKNLGCILIGNTESRYGEEGGLTLKKPAGSSDSHSSSFHRLLVQELDLGRSMSPACQRVIDQGLPQMNRSCAKN